MTDPPQIYSAQDAAKKLRTSVDTVRNIARTHEIGFIVGGRRLFTDDDVNAMRKRQPAPGATPTSTPSQRAAQRAREREVRHSWPPERKRESIAKLEEFRQSVNDEVRAVAHRSGKLWEPWEDDLTMSRRGKTLAMDLGRTLGAVTSRRALLRKRAVKSAAADVS